MATTKCTERVNLSLTKEERAHLERVAGTEDREITYVAAWFVRWGLQQYRNLGMTLTEMKNADYFNDDHARLVRSKIRLKLREAAANNHVPETNEQVRKRA